VVELTPEEARVVGALAEKELATPQYYPLTLNALVNACNQTSNRDPVVSYDEATVAGALASLRDRGLARIVHSVHNRAAKYRHVLHEVHGLETPELALLCVLLLRGPQTVGELRARTERLAELADVSVVEAALEALASRDEPLVARLERQPGQKEARYRTTLVLGAEPGPMAPASAPRTQGGDEIAALREEVAALREEVAELRRLVE